MTTERLIDASAAVLALSGKGEAADVLRGSMRQWQVHAPHLIDAEVGNVLRRHVRRGQLTEVEARAALGHLQVLVDHRYRHGPDLLRRAWDLGNNLTFYDALYVALAGALGIPLVTLDERLAQAPHLPCEVEVVGG